MTVKSKRDHAIDLIRAGCIISMTFGHLALGTLPDKILHLPPWFDGASGFVLLSGLVLGMVQRKRTDRLGLRAAGVKVAQRVRTLYLAQAAIVLLALTVGTLTAAAWWMPTLDGEGGPLLALIKVASLRINPHGINILSMYVILLALAVGATVLLAKRRGKTMLLASVALYVFASAFPQLTTLPQGAGVPGFFNWGCWQLIFFSAFFAGWAWDGRSVRARILAGRFVVVTAAVGVLLVGAGVSVARLNIVPVLAPAGEWFFDKGNAGPGRVLMAWIVFILAYWCLVQADRWVGLRNLEPLLKVGRRSLDSFVVLTLFTIAAPVLAGTPSEAVAILCAVLALIVMWGWAALRDKRQAVPQHQTTVRA